MRKARHRRDGAQACAARSSRAENGPDCAVATAAPALMDAPVVRSAAESLFQTHAQIVALVEAEGCAATLTLNSGRGSLQRRTTPVCSAVITSVTLV